VEPHKARETVGRYALYDVIASGGMATVHYGRLVGPVGFTRTVAIKKLHPQHARDAEFVSMFVDEARLAARIRHPNVVPTLDVVAQGRELYVVMDYVLGATLSDLIRTARAQRERIPPPIVSSIMAGCLHGLHAAHETCDDNGAPLGIVHRDVSPQNILVGKDGMARLLDFGIAKAARRMGFTRAGDVKGKVAYMAPEQLRGAPVTCQADVYATAVTLWEALTNLRAFVGNTDEIIKAREEDERLPPPSEFDPSLAAFDHVVMRGLEPKLEQRYPSAKAMAHDLELCGPLARHVEVAEWLEQVAWATIDQRSQVLARIEREASQSEVRAAIHDALSLEGPSAVTTDEVRHITRDETPTRVEPQAPRKPDSDAPTRPEPNTEDSRDRTSVPVAIDPRSYAPPPPPTSSWTFHLVVFGGAAAVIVGGFLAFLALRAASTPTSPAPAATTAEPPAQPTAAQSTPVAAEPTPERADKIRPAASADVTASAPPKRATPKPAKPKGEEDLFDSLGGRH